jgi:hypothetical protein
VAEGRPGRPAGDVPAAPQLSDAERASARAGWRRPEAHPYPGCFVCGPLREDDGLRLLAGPVEATRASGLSVAPGGGAGRGDDVDPVLVWAALDCPSGFACIPAGTSTVLASMTATLEAPVRSGGDYVVTAWPLGSEGRKHRAGSAIHEAGGRRVAWAETLWITLRAA